MTAAPADKGTASWGAQLLGLASNRLVLASGSPRRARILEELGVPFTVRPVEVVETFLPGEAPEDACLRLARAKAQRAARRGGTDLVLGADTVVVIDGLVLGKPQGEVEARLMLERLSGREHRVSTGLALVRERDGAAFTGLETTRVRFAPIPARDLEILIASGEPFDKAGAYGIQGLAALVVERIEGDYLNVVGLPLARLRRVIEEAVK